MRLLILGGTVFVGRHLAELAHRRGHEVTLFHRGTRPGVLPHLEHIHGDRDGGLGALDGAASNDGAPDEGAASTRPQDDRPRSWDVVIDTSGYVPRLVGDALDALAGRFERYAFVSSISVYARPDVPHLDEDAELLDLDDPTTERVDGATYGGLKALCERAVHARLGAEALIVRPGLVAGPYDPTERFTYWVRRMDRPGPVALPDAADQPVQWIDARDLARFTLDRLEAGAGGTFNVVGPADRVTFGDLIDACAAAADADPERVRVPSDVLRDYGIRPFTDLPMWIPGDDANLLRVSSERARASGLRVRSLHDTVRAVRDWDEARPSEDRGGGLTTERERAVLQAWRRAQPG